MKRILIIAGLVLGALALIGFTKGETIILAMEARKVEKTSLIDLQSLLAPSMIVSTPQTGDGPFPVVFQFHGCAGARLAFQKQWAKIANDAGYVAVIVDSLRPRKVDRETALNTVCQGKRLIGMERTGDVLAAIDYVSDNYPIDREQIILSGWSHGAWTVMDFMTMDLKSSLPPALADYKGTPPTIKGTILFYPYCGIGTLSRTKKWRQDPKVLALIAGADTIVDHKQCLKQLATLSDRGIDITQTVYPDTEHAFDDEFIEDDWKDWHNPEYTADAMRRYREFLDATSG